MWEGGGLHRTRGAKALKELLHKLLKQKMTAVASKIAPSNGSQESVPSWILVLDADVAIVTDVDIIRQTLRSELITNQTHVVVSLRDNSSGGDDLLSTGAMLLKVAPWTDGFISAWLQELSRASEEGDPLQIVDAADTALALAVRRARKLGGPSAVVAMPLVSVPSGNRSDDRAVTVRDLPMVQLRGLADEVRRHFYQALHKWACMRPRGLWGRKAASLALLHMQALKGVIEDLISTGGTLVLHRRNRAVDKVEDHTKVAFNAFAAYARQWQTRGQRSDMHLLGLCMRAYKWVSRRASDADPDAEKYEGHRRCIAGLASLSKLYNLST